MRHNILKSTRFFAGGIYAGLAALAIFIATPSAATVVFEQPPLDGADSFASFFDEQSADDFTLANNTSITAVRWWGVFLDPGLPVDDLFSVRFFDDAGGVPAVNPFAEFNQPADITVIETPTGLFDFFGGPVVQFDVVLPSTVDLLAGTDYFFSVVNFFDAVDAEFFWLLSNDTGDSVVRFVEGDPWDGPFADGDFAFALIGDEQIVRVAEPSGVALLLAGLLGLGAMRYRRRRDAMSEGGARGR